MVCPDQKGNAIAGDILLQACLPDVLLWRCLTWYGMGSRNHLAPSLEPRQCAVFIMALSLDHAQSSAVQRVCLCLGRTRRAFYRDGATRLCERGKSRKRCQQGCSHGLVAGGSLVYTKP
jgi:hypothetical protein